MTPVGLLGSCRCKSEGRAPSLFIINSRSGLSRRRTFNSCFTKIISIENAQRLSVSYDRICHGNRLTMQHLFWQTKRASCVKTGMSDSKDSVRLSRTLGAALRSEGYRKRSDEHSDPQYRDTNKVIRRVLKLSDKDRKARM